MSVSDIRVIVLRREAAFRAVSRIVRSSDFEKIYNLLEPQGQRDVYDAAKRGDLEYVRTIVKSNRRHVVAVEHLSVRDLRELARNHGVPSWYTLSKEDLIYEVTTKINGPADATEREPD